MSWLLSIIFRRCYRQPNGEIEHSKIFEKRTVLVSNPVAYLADMAVRYRRVTVGDWKPTSVEIADHIVCAYPPVEVRPDDLSGDQLQALEDVYGEEPVRQEAPEAVNG